MPDPKGLDRRRFLTSVFGGAAALAMPGLIGRANAADVRGDLARLLREGTYHGDDDCLVLPDGHCIEQFRAAAFNEGGASNLLIPAQNRNTGVGQPGRPPADRSAYRHPIMGSSSTDPVASQIVLVFDSSGSMNAHEWDIQRRATANALRPGTNRAPWGDEIMPGLVESAILHKTGDKSVAICLVDFGTQPQMRIPWVDLRADNPDELRAKMFQLSEQIRNLPRRESGMTYIARTLDYCQSVLENCPWPATERKMIDVSGDGKENGMPIRRLEEARDRHMYNGTTVNGLAIVTVVPDLEEYFYRHLVTTDTVVGPDGISSQPGHVWAMARNMRRRDAQQEAVQGFLREVELALKMKISIEVAGLEDVHNIIQHARFDGHREFVAPYDPANMNVPAGLRQPSTRPQLLRPGMPG